MSPGRGEENGAEAPAGDRGERPRRVSLEDVSWQASHEPPVERGVFEYVFSVVHAIHRLTFGNVA